MSCNGCRVLRKGCSENCILRSCLQSIETTEAQGHATVFVAKFFGRATLMSFISNVPENQRSGLFQSLLYEAAGRTVNPVNGAVGLLGTGNWHVCQAAVETILRGGTLRPIPGILGGTPELDEASESSDVYRTQDLGQVTRPSTQKRRRLPNEVLQLGDLDLSLTSSGFQSSRKVCNPTAEKQRRSGTRSMNSEESVTTTCYDQSSLGDQLGNEPTLLRLFN